MSSGCATNGDNSCLVSLSDKGPVTPADMWQGMILIALYGRGPHGRKGALLPESPVIVRNPWESAAQSRRWP
jgi:hypothetical protein